MRFNPDEYENVKQRKTRFYGDNSDGRIAVEIVNQDLDEKAVVKAYVYLTREDQQNNLPKGIGHALEIRNKELSISTRGDEYESVNYTSWLENCEESAVGRALDNAGYASNAKCSRDEMEKAQRNSDAQKKGVPVNTINGVGRVEVEVQKKSPTTPSGSVIVMSGPNPLKGTGAFCELCKTELVLSISGNGYYCPKFKKIPGDHTRMKANQLEAYKKNKELEAQGDVPF